MLTLSQQQAQAVKKITAWWDDPSASQVFRLFGYAGTGKTTLARFVVDHLGLDEVRYAAFTGKAAHVLRRKGCVDASTIHRLIYQPTEQARDRLNQLIERLAAETAPSKRAITERMIEREKRRLRDNPAFVLRGDNPLIGVELIVLDEVSMVDEKMAADLESFGVRLLVLGDPAQLPPIKGRGYYTTQQPDYLLTEVHRSAFDSPVTALATLIRNLPDIPNAFGLIGSQGDSGRLRSNAGINTLLDADQVLVGLNKTRWELITEMRQAKGSPPGKPTPGDRIMILANNPHAGVFNGQQFTVTRVENNMTSENMFTAMSGDYTFEVVDDEGFERRLYVAADGFAGHEGENDAKRKGWRTPQVAATFADAVTVHKAQGSEWSRVLVVDESRAIARFSRNNGDTSHEAAKRWLYTAFTRASDQAQLIRPSAVL